MSTGSQEVSADRIASELKGNTLRVYWFVMNASNRSVGVREAQRALNFSSPTLALYHLDKLRDRDLEACPDGTERGWGLRSSRLSEPLEHRPSGSRRSSRTSIPLTCYP